jgi:hypothetical protein
VEPPAAKGTTTSIGLVGNFSWALAIENPINRETTIRLTIASFFMILPPFVKSI